MKWLVGSVVVMLAMAGGGALVHFKLVDPAVFGLAGEAASPPKRQNQAAAIPVEVATSAAATSTQDITAIGTLQSDESVQLAPEVAGRVASIFFDEGQPVKAGDVLVSLDKALVMASEEEAKVRLDLANANLDRAQRLAQNGAGTTRDLDAAGAERSTAAALLNSQRVQLSKHDITAPFDGVVGLRRVSTGSYVGIGTPLVNIEKIDLLKVDFKVPEANLRNVQVGQRVEVSVDAVAGRRFAGTVYAIDPMLDVNGRAVSIRARLPNEGLMLRPGLFARLTLKGLQERQVVTVPEAAIVARGQDRFVWTVVDGKAKESSVTIGARKTGLAEVDGLSPGTVVVTAGHTRLRDGASVEIVDNKTAQAEG